MKQATFRILFFSFVQNCPHWETYISSKQVEFPAFRAANNQLSLKSGANALRGLFKSAFFYRDWGVFSLSILLSKFQF
jgi:hypothetical protein